MAGTSLDVGLKRFRIFPEVMQPAGQSRSFAGAKFIAALSRKARDLPEVIG